MMRILIGMSFGAILFLHCPSRLPAEESWDRGYELMREAYLQRQEGEEEAARENMARALALFRRNAADRVSITARPEVEYDLEEGPLGVSLVENRSLFRIDLRTAPPPPREEPPARDDETILRLQQLIIQNLAQVIQDNAEMRALLSRLEAGSDETAALADLLDEVRDETSAISDLAQTVSDIRDRTEDIYDEVDRVGDDSDALRAVEDLAGDISDLRDAMDLLRDILSLVQDIKDDTDGIRELESRIDDVRSEVENLRE